MDVRCASAACTLSGGHGSAVNSVAWASAASRSPVGDAPCGQTHASEHCLVSVSFDAAMYVHDIRRPDMPVLGLAGHTLLLKGKAMHQASFTWGATPRPCCVCPCSIETRLLWRECHMRASASRSVTACVCSFGRGLRGGVISSRCPSRCRSGCPHAMPMRLWTQSPHLPVHAGWPRVHETVR